MIIEPYAHLCLVCTKARRTGNHGKCKTLMRKTREQIVTESTNPLSEAELIYKVSQRIAGVYAEKTA